MFHVDSEVSACSGNEPGSQKEVVSFKTSSAAFIIDGQHERQGGGPPGVVFTPRQFGHGQPDVRRRGQERGHGADESRQGRGARARRKSLKCSEILAAFDPPIEFGSHSDMVGSKDGYQAEHIIPTSAFHESGRSGARIAECSGYTTPSAMTWMVGDGQSAGQEHKILTDAMREFSQANDLAGREAPLSEWLDKYKEGAKDALKNGEPRRKNTREDLDDDSLIDAAAECIRAHAAEAFAKLDLPRSRRRHARCAIFVAGDARRSAAVADTLGGSGGGGL